MTNTINALKAAKVQIGTLWFDVENPPAWPTNVATNRKFVEDMANVAINAGYKIGIYTGAYAWNTICGSSYTSYSSYPLWWANYNKKADLTTGWKNFGGWTKATIHQYDQNHSANGLIFDPNVK
uniref:Lysozyme n=1 Tax=Panagrolaimus sp. ES5 TaxID=591445 RepID=A0AC34GF01_9BILA